MQLQEDVRAFGNACEHLIISMATHRPLTKEEVLFIRHYCQELLEKISGPPHGSSTQNISKL